MLRKKLLTCAQKGHRNVAANLLPARFVFQRVPEDAPGKTDHVRDTAEAAKRKTLKPTLTAGEKRDLAVEVTGAGNIDAHISQKALDIAEQRITRSWVKQWEKLRKEGLPKPNLRGVKLENQHQYALWYFLQAASKGNASVDEIRRNLIRSNGKIDWDYFEKHGNTDADETKGADVLDLYYADGEWKWARDDAVIDTDTGLGGEFRKAIPTLIEKYGAESYDGEDVSGDNAKRFAEALKVAHTKMALLEMKRGSVAKPAYDDKIKPVFIEMLRNTKIIKDSLKEGEWISLSQEAVRASYALGMPDAERFIYMKRGDIVYALKMFSANGQPYKGSKKMQRIDLSGNPSIPDENKHEIFGEENFAGLWSRVNMTTLRGPEVEKELQAYARQDFSKNPKKYAAVVPKEVSEEAAKAGEVVATGEVAKYAKLIALKPALSRFKWRDLQVNGAGLKDKFDAAALKAVETYKRQLGKDKTKPMPKELNDSAFRQKLAAALTAKMISNFDKEKARLGKLSEKVRELRISCDDSFQFTIDPIGQNGKKMPAALAKSAEKAGNAMEAVMAKVRKITESKFGMLFGFMYTEKQLKEHFMAELNVPAQPKLGLEPKPIQGFGMLAWFMGVGDKKSGGMMAGLAKSFPILLTAKKFVQDTVHQLAGMAGMDLKDAQKVAYGELRTLAQAGSPIEGDKFELAGASDEDLKGLYIKDIKEKWSVDKRVTYRRSSTSKWQEGYLDEATPGMEIRLTKAFDGMGVPKDAAVGMEIPEETAKSTPGAAAKPATPNPKNN